MIPELKIEMWGKEVSGTVGTIRTEKENYYVADILPDGTLRFDGLEAGTKDIDQSEVLWWWIKARHED